MNYTDNDMQRLMTLLDDCTDGNELAALQLWKTERKQAQHLQQAVVRAWYEQQTYYGIDELEVRKDGSKAIVAQHHIKPNDMKQFVRTHHLMDEQKLKDVALGLLERYESPGREYKQSHFAH